MSLLEEGSIKTRTRYVFEFLQCFECIAGAVWAKYLERCFEGACAVRRGGSGRPNRDLRPGPGASFRTPGSAETVQRFAFWECKETIYRTENGSDSKSAKKASVL